MDLAWIRKCSSPNGADNTAVIDPLSDSERFLKLCIGVRRNRLLDEQRNTREVRFLTQHSVVVETQTKATRTLQSCSRLQHSNKSKLQSSWGIPSSKQVFPMK